MKLDDIHIDGSNCSNRKSMPFKSQIAFYWREKAYEIFDYSMDWGEPSCWACNYWNENKPDLEDSDTDIKTTFSYWNKHTYLERCHILPKAHGGCNCEANLVLLCKNCHKESPDTKNKLLFQKWIKNRKSWFQRRIIEIEKAFEELNYSLEGDDDKLVRSKGFKKYLKGNAILVGGKIADSTFVACFIEYKKSLETKIN